MISNCMATTRQKRVAKLIIENATLDKPLTGGQMLEKVRYGKISKQPSRILESQGVKDALNDFGFSESNAKKVVGEILMKEKAQDKDRLKAADMVFEVHGSKAPTKTANLNLSLDVKPEQLGALERIREEYEQKLKISLQS